MEETRIKRWQWIGTTCKAFAHLCAKWFGRRKKSANLLHTSLKGLENPTIQYSTLRASYRRAAPSQVFSCTAVRLSMIAMNSWHVEVTPSIPFDFSNFGSYGSTLYANVGWCTITPPLVSLNTPCKHAWLGFCILKTWESHIEHIETIKNADNATYPLEKAITWFFSKNHSRIF